MKSRCAELCILTGLARLDAKVENGPHFTLSVMP